MVIAKIEVSGTTAKLISHTKIPKGIVGAKIQIEYSDSAWDDLCKTVVFRGGITKDIVNADAEVTIPAEVVSIAGINLSVGIYGTDVDSTVVIPTLWVDLGKVYPSADPSGDLSTNPALPVWAQLTQQYERLLDLALNPPKADWNAAEGADGHILNRTHWIEEAEKDVSFDGNLDGREYVQAEDELYLVKMSDTVYKATDLIGHTVTAYMEGEDPDTMTMEITEDSIDDLTSEGLPFLMAQQMVWICKEDATVSGITIPKGTYFLCIQSEGVSRFYTISCSVLPNAEEVIHKLDNRYLNAEWMAHYKTGTEMLLDKAEQPFSGSSSRNSCNRKFYFKLQPGKDYLVSWDDVNYTVSAKVMTSGFLNYIGNGSIYSSDVEDTGEPFCIMELSLYGININTSIYTSDNSTTHTVGVWLTGSVADRIPFDFMPLVYTMPSDLMDIKNHLDELSKAHEILIQGGTVLAAYNNSVYKVLSIYRDYIDAMYDSICITNGSKILFWDKRNGWCSYGENGFTITTPNYSEENLPASGKKYKFTVDESGALIATDVTPTETGG